MKISSEITKKIAELIKIRLRADEVKVISEQLDKALEPAKMLSELNTDNIEITSQTTGNINVFRKDIVKQSLTQEEALKNAHKHENGYFIVPKFLKEND